MPARNVNREWAIGIDLGGSRCRIGLVHRAGRLEQTSEHVGTETWTPEDCLDVITRAARGFEQDPRLAASPTTPIGVALPGFLSGDGRRVAEAVNLPKLVGSELPIHLRAALNRPVTIDADCHAAGRAEHRVGAGQGVRRLLVASIGTGIGATVLVNGEVLRFTRNGAGSLGHIVVAPDGPLCRCGTRGCLEAMANGAAFERDIPAAARWLAVGIVTWCAVFRPDRVLLCGGVSAIGPPLMEALGRSLRDIGGASNAGSVDVRLGALGPRAALLGAGLMALEAADS